MTAFLSVKDGMNLNREVWVKLTDAGIEQMRLHYADLMSTQDAVARCVDRGRIAKFQLWEIGNIFGKFMFNGGETQFEDNLIHFVKPE
mgnify:CR=1 FL=1